MDGVAKIKGFERVLVDKFLAGVSGCWYALSDESDSELEIPVTEEVSEPESYFEGATKTISVNAYERNPKARAKCIEHYGCKCFICKFDFHKVYGEIGKNFIHVHHEVALAEIKETYKVDPIKDLKPLCPNCHAIIHRTRPAIEVKELIDAIA